MLYRKKSLTLHSQTSDGVIAQLVEQRTENPCVPGSIPGDTTENKTQIIDCQLFGFFLSSTPTQSSKHFEGNSISTMKNTLNLVSVFIHPKPLQIRNSMRGMIQSDLLNEKSLRETILKILKFTFI